MYLNRAYRQIAFVSYGNEYLNGAVDTEILDRHPLLFNHFPILRDTKYGTLLCGSASHLLSRLQESGAIKLSLHVAQDLHMELNDSSIFYFSTDEESFCIVVHYPHNEYKVLIHSDEKPTWQSFDKHGNKDFYDYSNYYQNVEAYTLHHPSPQAISTIEQDLKPINWDTFFKDTEARLYFNDMAKQYGSYPIPLNINNCYVGDLFNDSIKEQYPIFPFTIRKNYASNLIENTALLEQQYSAASHSKNEYSDYVQMNSNERDTFSAAYNQLTLLRPLIFKHCANQYQFSDIKNCNYLSNIPETTKDFSIEKNTVQIPTSNDVVENTAHLKDIEHQVETKSVAVSSFNLFKIMKFLWYIIWCYCALWTLAFYSVSWGNTFILAIAFLYALYKSIIHSNNKKDR
ncbi:hypothetical protein WH285_09185 [Acinetobacter johnsonii]|uniref:hypothetical protein n=1 Tax=Acinetobacter johnsonii TaxID=40214 RepID=UPI0030B009FF